MHIKSLKSISLCRGDFFHKRKKKRNQKSNGDTTTPALLKEVALKEAIEEASEEGNLSKALKLLTDDQEESSRGGKTAPKKAQREFLLCTASAANRSFENEQSLLDLDEALAEINRMYPKYHNTNKIDELRKQEYGHLDGTPKVCLDYCGFGLFSYLQQFEQWESSAIYSVEIPVTLTCHALNGNPDLGTVEYDIKYRIMDYLNIPRDEYRMVFTTSRGSAFQLLADAYPFQYNHRLLTMYDYQSESVNWMAQSAKKRGAKIYSAWFQWPSLKLCSEDLRNLLKRKKKRARGSAAGLFVYPCQSRVTGAKYSYQWMSLAQKREWHVLLDAGALGPKDMDSLGLSLFRPDFIITSFYKLFGSDATGFGCIFIKHTALCCLENKATMTGSGTGTGPGSGSGIVRILPLPYPSDSAEESVPIQDEGMAADDESKETSDSAYETETSGTHLSAFSGPLSSLQLGKMFVSETNYGIDSDRNDSISNDDNSDGFLIKTIMNSPVDTEEDLDLIHIDLGNSPAITYAIENAGEDKPSLRKLHHDFFHETKPKALFGNRKGLHVPGQSRRDNQGISTWQELPSASHNHTSPNKSSASVVFERSEVPAKTAEEKHKADHPFGKNFISEIVAVTDITGQESASPINDCTSSDRATSVSESPRESVMTEQAWSDAKDDQVASNTSEASSTFDIIDKSGRSEEESPKLSSKQRGGNTLGSSCISEIMGVSVSSKQEFPNQNNNDMDSTTFNMYSGSAIIVKNGNIRQELPDMNEKQTDANTLQKSPVYKISEESGNTARGLLDVNKNGMSSNASEASSISESTEGPYTGIFEISAVIEEPATTSQESLDGNEDHSASSASSFSDIVEDSVGIGKELPSDTVEKPHITAQESSTINENPIDSKPLWTSPVSGTPEEPHISRPESPTPNENQMPDKRLWTSPVSGIAEEPDIRAPESPPLNENQMASKRLWTSPVIEIVEEADEDRMVSDGLWTSRVSDTVEEKAGSTEQESANVNKENTAANVSQGKHKSAISGWSLLKRQSSILNQGNSVKPFKQNRITFSLETEDTNSRRAQSKKPEGHEEEIWQLKRKPLLIGETSRERRANDHQSVENSVQINYANKQNQYENGNSQKERYIKQESEGGFRHWERRGHGDFASTSHAGLDEVLDASARKIDYTIEEEYLNGYEFLYEYPESEEEGEDGWLPYIRTDPHIICRHLDHIDSLGLNRTSSRLSYLINWLIKSLLQLRHPAPAGTSQGTHLVHIYGPKIKYERGPAVAFNLFRNDRSLINPEFVQQLAERHRIYLGLAFLSHLRVMENSAEIKESVGAADDSFYQQKDKKRREGRNVTGRVAVLSASLGFLTNFEDVYKLWVFAARFLNADFAKECPK